MKSSAYSRVECWLLRYVPLYSLVLLVLAACSPSAASPTAPGFGLVGLSVAGALGCAALCGELAYRRDERRRLGLPARSRPPVAPGPVEGQA